MNHTFPFLFVRSFPATLCTYATNFVRHIIHIASLLTNSHATHMHSLWQISSINRPNATLKSNKNSSTSCLIRRRSIRSIFSDRFFRQGFWLSSASCSDSEEITISSSSASFLFGLRPTRDRSLSLCFSCRGGILSVPAQRCDTFLA